MQQYIQCVCCEHLIMFNNSSSITSWRLFHVIMPSELRWLSALLPLSKHVAHSYTSFVLPSIFVPVTQCLRMYFSFRKQFAFNGIFSMEVNVVDKSLLDQEQNLLHFDEKLKLTFFMKRK